MYWFPEAPVQTCVSVVLMVCSGVGVFWNSDNDFRRILDNFDSSKQGEKEEGGIRHSPDHEFHSVLKPCPGSKVGRDHAFTLNEK